MSSNTPSPGLVEQVTNAVADPEHPVVLDANGQLTQETVNRVIVAYDTFRLGTPVGTWMRNPETGEMALRIDDPERGAVWQVTGSTGAISYNTQPTLPSPWVELPSATAPSQ